MKTTRKQKKLNILSCMVHGIIVGSPTVFFCRMCGITFGSETEYNVFRLKGLFFVFFALKHWKRDIRRKELI